MQTLFYIGIIFVAGSFIRSLCKEFGVLSVVGYLVLGFAFGPNGFGVIPHSFVEESHLITDLSLSLISVLVGSNLKYDAIKRVSSQILIVAFLEALVTFVLVSTAMYFLFKNLYFSFTNEQIIIMSIIFGGLAVATAPATILAIIHELKAKGRYSTFLLGVVALDNAIALIFFSFILIISNLVIGSEGYSFSSMLDIIPVVGFTILIGVIGGLASNYIDNFFKYNKSFKTTSTLGMIFIVYSLSYILDLEPLLATLVMGIVMANVSNEFYIVKDEFDGHLKDIIFLLFFTLSAMHLQFDFISEMPSVIVVYVLFRVLGKFIGVRIGATISNASMDVKNTLGLALLPQAGIAIGLALALQGETGFETISPIVLNIIISTTMVHEFIGPIFTRFALKRSETHYV